MGVSGESRVEELLWRKGSLHGYLRIGRAGSIRSYSGGVVLQTTMKVAALSLFLSRVAGLSLFLSPAPLARAFPVRKQTRQPCGARPPGLRSACTSSEPSPNLSWSSFSVLLSDMTSTSGYKKFAEVSFKIIAYFSYPKHFVVLSVFLKKKRLRVFVDRASVSSLDCVCERERGRFSVCE